MKNIIIITLLLLTSFTYEDDYICECKKYKNTTLKHKTPLLEVQSNLNNVEFSDFINNLSENTLFLNQNVMNSEFQALSDFFVPNLSVDSQYINSPIIGHARAKDTALVRSIFKKYLQENEHLIDSKVKFLWSFKPKELFNDGYDYYSFYAINKNNDYQITHNELESAQISKHPRDTNYGVSIIFDNEGSEVFSDFSKQRQMKFISIISYNKVLSAPIILQQVKGGYFFIDGDFTKPEAETLRDMINCFAYVRRIGERKFERESQNCK